MSDQKKTLSQLERERGVIIQGASANRKFTDEEFNAFLAETDSANIIGCNHEDREKFLRANGYEVNRKNMIDSELSAVPEEEK